MLIEVEVELSGRIVVGMADVDVTPPEHGDRNEYGVQMTPDFPAEITINSFESSIFKTSDGEKHLRSEVGSFGEELFDILDILALEEIQNDPDKYIDLSPDYDYD